MVIFLEIHLEIFEMTKLSTTNRNSEDIYLFGGWEHSVSFSKKELITQ